MNRTTALAAIVLSFAAAGSAFADGDVYSGPQAAAASGLSRAQVQAQLQQDRAATRYVTEAQLNASPVATSARTRADVRAETLQAIARHELRGNDIELSLHSL